MSAHTFGNGDAEARVAARYAGIDGNTIAAYQRKAQAEREHYVVSNGVRHDVPQVATVHPIRPASEKAIKFLVDLSGERRPDVAAADVLDWATSVDKAEVSAKIDWLKTLPKVVNSGVGAKTYDVPAGRYAVTGERDQTVFVKVDVPDAGPFKGRTFLRIQASDELIRVSPQVRDALLAKIEADGLKAASTRYGRELGDCGVCGRTLTDEVSRAAGVGPVCRSKMGW